MKAAAKKKTKKRDTRVARTRDRLGDAIIELMQEQPFEQITVQHVLDRAGVSRSTFYSHYANKEDLFLGDVDDFWQMMADMLSRRKEKSKRIAPVRELFAHVADVGDFRRALQDSGKMHDVMELGRAHFVRAIDERLRDVSAVRKSQRAVLAPMLSGALFSLLDTWLSSPTKQTPEQMDDLFHQIAWRAIGESPASQSPWKT